MLTVQDKVHIHFSIKFQKLAVKEKVMFIVVRDYDIHPGVPFKKINTYNNNFFNTKHYSMRSCYQIIYFFCIFSCTEGFFLGDRQSQSIIITHCIIMNSIHLKVR